MHDDKTPHTDRLSGNPHLSGRPLAKQQKAMEGTEGACPAFGYLRGLHERASSIEFRMGGGSSIWFPYAWLGTVTFDPSQGLLIKFSGDLTYLVLIRGSNLDRAVESGIDLIRAGLQRHRILWMREMDEEEAEQETGSGPTIDSIQVAEFESNEALKEWLGKMAPSFMH
ncbi:MAG: hypothetical protein KDE55_12130 [Novosphingobium sp.]|nr:hypothetical protein [Novosphingobium sp.]